MGLGAMRDSWEFKIMGPRPGFVGHASWVSILSCIPDGLRVGDLAAKHVWPKAEDIANMALFLSSHCSRLVSGQVIAVDGHTEVPDPKV